MSQDLIGQSQIDQQFGYAYQILSSPPQPNYDENLNHQQLYQQMELQTHTQEINDFFDEPNYIRRPLAKLVEKNNENKVEPLPNVNLLHVNPIGHSLQKQKIRDQGKVGKKYTSRSQDDEDISSQHKMGKKINKKTSKKKEKREQYPTKNFLPSFRSSFINYLAAHYEQNNDYFENLEIISRIKGKPCINLTDYQDLFRVRQFRPILKVYFKDRVIVRDLLQSRIQYETKLVYLRKIHVFEQAFESGVFKRIN